MADKRIHNPDKSCSADVSRVSRSHDKMAIYPYMVKTPTTLSNDCTLVYSQVSDRCPWASCLFIRAVIMIYLFVLDDSFTSKRFTTRTEQLT